MKFLHTADWQIGKPFARVGDPDKRAKLRAERLEAISRIATAAKEQAAEFVLVAGDLFDSFTADKSAVSAACSAIGGIGVPVLAIPGNHDHGGPGCLWKQEFFRTEQESLAPDFRILLDRAPVELDSAVIYPCPLLRRHESSDPTEWLRSTAVEGDKPRIVLAHGSVHGFSGDSTDEESGEIGAPNLIALDRLPAGAFDYVALGDWHGCKQIAPNAWYCGTPEIDRFPKGDGNDPGNVLSVKASRGKPPVVQPIRTGGIGWSSLDFSFTGDSDLERLDELLKERIENRTRRDLIHLTLGGVLGIDAAARLDELLERWDSRLLRLKLANRVRLSPSDEEVAALAERSGDPLISSVAKGLIHEAGEEGEQAEIARIALRELHAACRP